MNLIWAAFRAAVNHAVDERNKEARRTRALERITAAVEELAEQGRFPDYYAPAEPPKGSP